MRGAHSGTPAFVVGQKLPHQKAHKHGPGKTHPNLPSRPQRMKPAVGKAHHTRAGSKVGHGY